MIQGDKLGRHLTVADVLLAVLNVQKKTWAQKKGNVTWLRTNDRIVETVIKFTLNSI